VLSLLLPHFQSRKQTLTIGQLEFKAILAMLVRLLEFRDMAAVVQQKNAPVSSLLRMRKWGCYRWAIRLCEGGR
jgi:hypothetical protein